MKKIYFLVFVFCFSFLFTFSQTPDWVWAKSPGSGEGYLVATDSAENAYIGGSYVYFFTKYDQNGNLLWNKSFPTGGARINTICTDNHSNLFIAGSFNPDTVIFDNDTLVNGKLSTFLVKYDSSGNVLWAKGNTGGYIDGANAYSGATDANGNAYITGYFDGTVSFGGHSLTSAGSTDNFLVKYDPSGNVIWAKRAGGMQGDWGQSIATDASGNVYLIGAYFSDTITFGAYTLVNASAGNNRYIFLAKYDSLGNVLWAKSFGGSNNDFGTGVATDGSGNLYFIGDYTSDSITFGTITLIRNGNNATYYIVKYDSSGMAIWAKNIINASEFMTTNKSDKIYLTGGFYIHSLPVIIDTISLHYPAGSIDALFVAGLDTAGHALFAKLLTSGGDDEIGVAVSPSGCIYICSDFEPDTFVVSNDTLIRTNSNQEGVFVAKLCSSDIIESNPEISKDKVIVLYPNPFNDKLTIVAKSSPEYSGLEIIIYDIASKKLIQQKFASTLSLNTSLLAEGVYIYEIKNNTGLSGGVIERGKIVKF